MYTSLTTDISYAARILMEGRVVAFPTGTSYGLAVDALQGHALQRLRRLKKRPTEKTFTLCMAEKMWTHYLDISSVEQRVLQYFNQRPLTLLVHPKDALRHLAHDGRVGLRVVDHPLMQQLVDSVAVPLTATSANLTGQSPCYDPTCILGYFPGRIDDTTYELSLGCIVDGGQLAQRPATTIARIDPKAGVTITRQGDITQAELEQVVRS